MNTTSHKSRVYIIAAVISLIMISCICPFPGYYQYIVPLFRSSGPSAKPTNQSPTNNPGNGSLPDKFELVFDSTMTTINGAEEVRATVPLTFNANGVLTGVASLEILQNSGDQIGGGGCQDNKFDEKPGNFTVVSATLIYTSNSTPDEPQLQDVILVYSLNSEVVCTVDGSFRPNDWNLFWMVYDGHFTHTDDTLDDSGPIPLITAQKFNVNGLKAQKSYFWTGVAGTAEKTSINLYPAP
jgi:hypothetical protein